MKRKLLLAALCVVGALGFTAQAQDAGTYYIQNVGTGKWLGPGNSWGTQASVLNHADYWKLAKISDGVYTLESVVTNGGTNYYLTGSYCDGAATNFTFTAITGKENTYSIANANGGYLTTNGTTVDVSATDASAEVAQWKLWSEDDMTAGMTAATKDNPFDATYLIKDHDLGRNNRDYSAWSNTGATAPKTSDKNVSGASRYSIEAYRVVFDVNQTLSSVPNGVYAVRVNGFYRQDGNDANLPYVYANDSKTTLPARTGTENNMQAAAVSFEAGNYLSEPAYVQVTDGTLKIGVATTGTSCWSIFKNFHLNYYGDVTVAEVILADYVNAYNTALAAAQAYQSADMFDDDKAALNTAISDNTLDLSSVTKEQLTTAAANLNAAATAAAKATVKFTTYNNIVTAVNGNTNVDITSYIRNLGFEEGTLTAWTSDNGGGVANNNNYSGKVGTYFVERWQNGVALGAGSLTHDAIVLPAGVYTFKANAQNIEQYNNGAAGTGYFLCVDDEKTEIGAAGVYEVAVKYTGEKNTSTIKFLLDNCTGNWISCDNIVVTYVGEDYPALTAVGGPMNATVRQAQTAALDTYNANKTGENYKAAVEAIAAAQASVNAYKYLTAAVNKIMAVAGSVSENGGTITSEQQTALAALYLAYNTGTIADADVLSKVAEGYNLVAPIVKTQTAASADFTLAIINQSFEYGDMTGWTATESSDTGVRETSNATYAATGSDGFYLFNTWWQGVPLTQKVEDLPNGQYTLTASVASDGATIYLIANGEHNEGTETGGTYPTSDTFQEATITFLVKDGKATIGVVGGADGNAGEHKDYVAEGYWWYKADNFRLVKNRDLTPEEEIVYATDADYAVLERTIKAAEEKVLGFDAGDYAPYNNVEALAALKAAKAIDPTVQNVQKDVQAAANALGQANWTANTEEVNAVYDGTFANATNNGAPAGWTMSNNTLGGALHSRAFNPDEQNRLSEFNSTNSGLFLRFDGTNSNRGSMYYYGDTDGYTMPLKANTTYYAKVDFAGWGSTGKPLRMNVTGPEGFTAQSQQFNTSVRADNADNEPQQFLIVFTTTVAGNYVINFQTPGSDDNKHNVVVSNIELLKAQSVELAVDATAKYGTFVAPFDVTIPEGVIAYTVEAPKEGNVLTLTQEEKISANKPVLLYAENGYGAKPVYGYAKPENEPKNGLLTGTYEPDGAIAPTGSYVLQLHEGNTEPAFYRVEDNASFAVIVPANRAYLTLPSAGAGVRALFFSTEGEATGIAGLEVLTSGNYDAIYTAGGAKVESLQKGLNIVVKDGKSYKIFVK